MNFQWYNILAADNDGLIGTIIFVALLIFSLIGQIIKKAQEKRQVEEADRKVEQAKRRHAAAETSSERAQTKSPPMPSAHAAGAPVIHAAADLGQGVGQEVMQTRKQLAAKERQQQRRLAEIKHLQPTIGETAARAERAVAGGPKIHLNLTSPKAAKTAIICAEILGSPKALRTDPEPWDM